MLQAVASREEASKGGISVVTLPTDRYLSVSVLPGLHFARLHNLSDSQTALILPAHAKRWKRQDGPSAKACLGAVGEAELLRDDVSGQRGCGQLMW